MSESQVWNKFNEVMKKKFLIKRIEDRLRKGTLDSFWIHKETGKMGYLEYKYEDYDNTRCFKIPIKQEQIIEAFTWAEFSKSVGILAAFGNIHFYFPAIHSISWTQKIGKPLLATVLANLPHYHLGTKIDPEKMESLLLEGTGAL